MAHRKWKEAKQLPGTAGLGNMLGCCLISFHFLLAIHPIRPVHTQGLAMQFVQFCTQTAVPNQWYGGTGMPWYVWWQNRIYGQRRQKERKGVRIRIRSFIVPCLRCMPSLSLFLGRRSHCRKEYLLCGTSPICALANC